MRPSTQEYPPAFLRFIIQYCPFVATCELRSAALAYRECGRGRRPSSVAPRVPPKKGLRQQPQPSTGFHRLAVRQHPGSVTLSYPSFGVPCRPDSTCSTRPTTPSPPSTPMPLASASCQVGFSLLGGPARCGRRLRSDHRMPAARMFCATVITSVEVRVRCPQAVWTSGTSQATPTGSRSLSVRKPAARSWRIACADQMRWCPVARTALSMAGSWRWPRADSLFPAAGGLAPELRRSARALLM